MPFLFSVLRKLDGNLPIALSVVCARVCVCVCVCVSVCVREREREREKERERKCVPLRGEQAYLISQPLRKVNFLSGV